MRQGPTEPSDRLALRQARTWVVLGLSMAFLLIGALFILAPRWGAALFGIPAPEDRGLAYVRAIGFRDLALALYIVGLTLFSSRRALSTVLALTVLIPVGDIGLVATVMGLSSPGHLALHGVSAICFALLAVWVRRDRS
jgi:Domain of unknown function (DUF4267)